MRVNVDTPLTTLSIQNELLSYLEDHPNAADTAEGIRQWWLIKRIADYSKDIVEASLDQLVESKSVKKKQSTSGNEIYELNRQ